MAENANSKTGPDNQNILISRHLMLETFYSFE